MIMSGGVYMFKADMHVHTTSSDGLFEPEETVEWAKKKGIDVIAITDHDTVDGIERAVKAGKEFGVRIVPGVEMSCAYKDDEVHVVGLFIDYKNRELKERLENLSENRTLRGKKIVDRLNSLGVEIKYEDVLNEAKCGSVGKPHIARVLAATGAVKSFDEAFNKYLAKGKPADIAREKITVEEAVKLIKNAGGVAVVAHPGLLVNKNYPLELIFLGIDGMEVIHSIHDNDTVERIGKIVRDKKLLKSAGSDCHGNLIDGVPIVGNFYLNEEEFEKIEKVHLERVKENAKE